MKPLKKNIKKKLPSKGERLKWEPLNEVKPVPLNYNMTVGFLVNLPKFDTSVHQYLVP